MREVTFVVTEDETDGGYTARSHWPDGNRDLFTEGDTREELVRNIREVVDVTFDSEKGKPDLIHLPLHEIVNSDSEDAMATIKIPKNAGKVRVAMYLGGKYTVWNGKQGQHEFAIICRDRKQAEEIARKINNKEHNGEIDVTH